MTEEEMDKLTEDLREYLDRQNRQNPERPLKRKRKGLYSKIIVSLCILLAVGYTGVCLLMQWRTGTQPEPQLTISFMGFVAVELWNLAKIRRDKDKG